MGTGYVVGLPSGPHRPLPRLRLLRRGMTALLRAAMRSASNRHLPAIRALIDAGAALDIQDSGSDECVPQLASPFSKAGRMPPWAARRYRMGTGYAGVGVPSGPHRPLPRLRLHRDAGGMTALHWAARCGHVPTVCALIRAGAALDIQDGCVPHASVSIFQSRPYAPLGRKAVQDGYRLHGSGYPLGHTDLSPAFACTGMT
jgi:hypothetical protein